MVFTAFTIKCGTCGWINKPDFSPSQAAYLVMSGEFKRCRHCGRVWREITVPARPVVRRYISIKVTHVIVIPYIGFPPMGVGY